MTTWIAIIIILAGSPKGGVDIETIQRLTEKECYSISKQIRDGAKRAGWEDKLTAICINAM